ncbi:MAG: type VII toxin-antitoxin system MntA family adenylyltransferase antitoxin [Spirochaetia bacterium]
MIKYESIPSDILERMPAAQSLLQNDDRVVFAYLFGGLARGAVNPLSDVDIAVYLARMDDSAGTKLSLFDSISDALGTTEIDLAVLNVSPISFVGRVLQNKRLLVDKEPFLRHRYESLKLREFFDFKIKEDAFFRRRYGI